MLKISSWLAVAFGVTLAVLEVARNWDQWEWWPFWVVDYIAATLLVAGGVVALRGVNQLLCAGWSFTCAMFWMSFFSHLDDALKAGAGISPHERMLTTIIGCMFAITVAGMATALLGRTPASSERKTPGADGPST